MFNMVNSVRHSQQNLGRERSQSRENAYSMVLRERFPPNYNPSAPQVQGKSSKKVFRNTKERVMELQKEAQETLNVDSQAGLTKLITAEKLIKTLTTEQQNDPDS